MSSITQVIEILWWSLGNSGGRSLGDDEITKKRKREENLGRESKAKKSSGRTLDEMESKKSSRKE